MPFTINSKVNSTSNDKEADKRKSNPVIQRENTEEEVIINSAETTENPAEKVIAGLNPTTDYQYDPFGNSDGGTDTTEVNYTSLHPIWTHNMSAEGVSRDGRSTYSSYTINSIYRWGGTSERLMNYIESPNRPYKRTIHVNGHEGKDFIMIYGVYDKLQINAGNGDDEVRLGLTGGATVSGGYGNDIIWGSFAYDTIYGNQGSDFMVGGYGNDIMRGHEGNDWVVGGEDDDLLSGDEGIDVLDGGIDDRDYRFDRGEDTFILSTYQAESHATIQEIESLDPLLAKANSYYSQYGHGSDFKTQDFNSMRNFVVGKIENNHKVSGNLDMIMNFKDVGDTLKMDRNGVDEVSMRFEMDGGSAFLTIKDSDSNDLMAVALLERSIETVFDSSTQELTIVRNSGIPGSSIQYI